MSKILTLILIGVLSFSIFAPAKGQVITFPNPLKATSFEELVENLIGFIQTIAIAIVPLMIIIGAFYILTSGGSEEKVKTGKNIITYSIIALIIILLAKALISAIKSILGVK